MACSRVCEYVCTLSRVLMTASLIAAISPCSACVKPKNGPAELILPLLSGSLFPACLSAEVKGTPRAMLLGVTLSGSVEARDTLWKDLN